MQLNHDRLHIKPYRGTLALVGPALTSAHKHFAPGAALPSHQLHITLLTATEIKQCRDHQAHIDLETSARAISLERIYVLGLVRHGEVAWLVVVWNHADIWRRGLGLGKKDYHVTTSEKNDHSLDKSVGCLFRNGGDVDEMIGRWADLGEDGLDHIRLGSPMYMQSLIAEQMILLFPSSFKGYIRLAESVRSSNPKLSLLCYARAIHLSPDLAQRVYKRICTFRDQASYGPAATQAELESIPPSLHEHLFHPFPEMPSVLWTHPTASRDRQIYHGISLPRNFSYIYPNIAGSSTPRAEGDIDAFIFLGFTHILTLTAETPLPAAWFTLRNMTHIYIPLENYHAPTLAEMDVIYDRVRVGGKWLVHCGGGVGRAGTVLACLLAMFGYGGANGESERGETHQPKLDGKTAISLLRAARPRSLESKVQEEFVSSWVSHRWKILNTESIPEPVTCLSYTSRPPPPDTPLCLFLIGRPGSGRSWLAEVLSKRRKCVVISQDDSGSRAACEREMARTYADDTLVVFDRCNPTREDRAYWISLVDRPIVAVYFDYAKELCRQRLDSRVGHPTIRAGRGGNALDQMDRQMQPPGLDEGFISIVTVTSFSAARQSIRLFSFDPPLLKFPRTPHLIDLGASTADDEVAPDFAEMTGALTLEEKIDGANMGISLDWDKTLRVQNRSHWVSPADHIQWKALPKWLETHESDLQRILDRDPTFPERYILYGEWCVARHSIKYDSLPDWFLAFDLFDRVSGEWASRRVLSRLLLGTGLKQVPFLGEREQLSKADLMGLLQKQSCFGRERIEGVYVRVEDEERKVTRGRGKVVRGDFIAGNEHWSKGRIEFNGIDGM